MTDRYEKIRLVAEQFGTWEFKSKSDEFKVSFERDGLRIEGEGTDDLDGIVSARFDVTHEGENVYQNVWGVVKENENSPAAIYKPGDEWERKLDELYVLAQKDREERIKKKLARFKGFLKP